jgi:hypothetical protein
MEVVMVQSSRLLLWVAFLAVLVGATLVLVPIGRLVFESTRDLPVILADLVKGQARNHELQADCDAAIDLVHAKSQVGGDLALGRITLLEAAARIRELDRLEAPVVLAQIRQAYPANSETERCCKEAITWVESWLVGHPEQDQAVLLRLRAELDEHLRRGTLGTIKPVAQSLSGERR